VDLALAAWSAPAGPAWASALASRCLRWLFVASSVGRQPTTPTSPPGVVLGRSAVSTMPPPLPSQPLDGGLPATTVAAPMRRRHGPLPRSFVSSPVSSFSSPCFYVHAMVAWPASQACLPMLLMCHAWACATAVLELLC
jgi:hypothetical protein